MNQIIYSLRVMKALIERGYVPLATIPNPFRPQFNCWVFAVNDQFLKDFREIAEGKGPNGKSVSFLS